MLLQEEENRAKVDNKVALVTEKEKDAAEQEEERL
jgi:hypothetical protein